MITRRKICSEILVISTLFVSCKVANSIRPEQGANDLTQGEPKYYDPETAEFVRNYKIIYLPPVQDSQQKLGLTTASSSLSRLFKVLNESTNDTVKRLKPRKIYLDTYHGRIELPGFKKRSGLTDDVSELQSVLKENKYEVELRFEGDDFIFTSKDGSEKFLHAVNKEGQSRIVAIEESEDGLIVVQKDVRGTIAINGSEIPILNQMAQYIASDLNFNPAVLEGTPLEGVQDLIALKKRIDTVLEQNNEAINGFADLLRRQRNSPEIEKALNSIKELRDQGRRPTNKFIEDLLEDFVARYPRELDAEITRIIAESMARTNTQKFYEFLNSPKAVQLHDWGTGHVAGALAEKSGIEDVFKFLNHLKASDWLNDYGTSDVAAVLAENSGIDDVFKFLNHPKAVQLSAGSTGKVAEALAEKSGIDDVFKFLNHPKASDRLGAYNISVAQALAENSGIDDVFKLLNHPKASDRLGAYTGTVAQSLAGKSGIDDVFKLLDHPKASDRLDYFDIGIVARALAEKSGIDDVFKFLNHPKASDWFNDYGTSYVPAALAEKSGIDDVFKFLNHPKAVQLSAGSTGKVAEALAEKSGIDDVFKFLNHPKASDRLDERGTGYVALALAQQSGIDDVFKFLDNPKAVRLEDSGTGRIAKSLAEKSGIDDVFKFLNHRKATRLDDEGAGIVAKELAKKSGIDDVLKFLNHRKATRLDDEGTGIVAKELAKKSGIDDVLKFLNNRQARGLSLKQTIAVGKELAKNGTRADLKRFLDLGEDKVTTTSLTVDQFFP